MTHLRPLPDDPGALLRYRCPADTGDDPGRHLVGELAGALARAKGAA